MQVQASAGHDPNNTNGNSGNATPRTYRICEMTRPHLGIGDWYLRTAAMSDQAEMTREEQKTEFLDLTTEVVSAYVSHNSISPTDLPRLIADVHSAITDLKEAEVPEQTADQPKPMVPIKKSRPTTSSVLRTAKSSNRSSAICGRTTTCLRMNIGPNGDCLGTIQWLRPLMPRRDLS